MRVRFPRFSPSTGGLEKSFLDFYVFLIYGGIMCHAEHSAANWHSSIWAHDCIDQL